MNVMTRHLSISRILFAFVAFILFPSFLIGQTWFTNGQSADMMLSGAGFNNTGGALVFNHPSGIASDGTRFLLCDRFNNRVLVWKTLPTAWNVQPDLVVGQSTFTGNNSGFSKSELNFPGNVSVGVNGVVTIADTDNDRILIWKKFPSSNGQPADFSIDLSSVSPQGIPIRFSWPWGVWTDGTRLAAVATQGSSILFWNALPTRDNQPPDYTVTHAHFGTPRNISTDGATYFFVGDHNSKVTGDKPGTFFWNSYPTQKDQPYDFYREGDWIKGTKLPDGKLVAGGLGSLYIWLVMPTSGSHPPDLTLTNPYYKNGDGPDVVYAGGRLYVNNYNGTNVHVYNSLPTQPSQNPDFTLGSLSVSVNMLDSIQYIQNSVMATDGSMLLATSDFDAALWIWKTIPTKSGAAPDIKRSLRTPTLDIAPWDNALSRNRLVLAGKRKVVVWNSVPLNGEAPSAVFTDRIGSFQFEELKGAALDSLYLYLSERNGRIGIWKGIPSSSAVEPMVTLTLPATNLNHIHSDGTYFTATVQDGNPRAAYIFRVRDFAAGVVPQPYKIVQSSPQLLLNLPSSSITWGGGLALANNSNNSVLLWKSVEDAGDASKVIVLGQNSVGETRPGIGQNKLHFPGSLAAWGNSLWVGEFKFSSRILKFQYPSPTHVGKEPDVRNLTLAQNYPNPFSAGGGSLPAGRHGASGGNPGTAISFQLPAPSARQTRPTESFGRAASGLGAEGLATSLVNLEVYDLLGRKVSTLVNAVRPAGTHRVHWDGRNDKNEPVASGVYFSVLKVGEYVVARKMLLTR